VGLARPTSARGGKLLTHSARRKGPDIPSSKGGGGDGAARHREKEGWWPRPRRLKTSSVPRRSGSNTERRERRSEREKKKNRGTLSPHKKMVPALPERGEGGGEADAALRKVLRGPSFFIDITGKLISFLIPEREEKGALRPGWRKENGGKGEELT